MKITGDSSRIFSGSKEDLYSDKGTFRIFYQNGTPLSKTSTGWITDLALAGNSSQCVIGTNSGGVFLFARDGSMSTISNDPLLIYFPIHALAISADGSTIAYSIWFDKSPRFIINQKKSYKKETTANVIKLIAVSSNGSYIAISEGEGSRGTVSMRYSNGTSRWTAKTPRANQLKMNEDGSLVVAGAADGSVFSLNRTGGVLWNFPADGVITTLSLNSQATKIVAGTTNGTIYLLDNNGSLLWTYHVGGVMNKLITSLEISRDGSSIIAVVNKRELLYFTTSEILPRYQVESSTGNTLVNSTQVNVTRLDPQNNSTRFTVPVNFSSLISEKSTISIEIRGIIQNLKSGQLKFDHRGGKSSWIALNPPITLFSGNSSDVIRNIPAAVATSNTTVVKSDQTNPKNSTGNLTTSNTTVAKSNQTNPKNSTGNPTTFNTTVVKSNPVPTANSSVTTNPPQKNP